MKPLMISAVPSVAMNALTRSLVTISPLPSPITTPSTTTATIPGTRFASSPAITSAATSELRLMTYATERSSEPHRITTVWPAATMPSATERCSMPTTLSTVRKLPPSIVTTTQAKTKTPSSAPNTGVAGELEIAARVPARLDGRRRSGALVVTLTRPPPRRPPPGA